MNIVFPSEHYGKCISSLLWIQYVTVSSIKKIIILNFILRLNYVFFISYLGYFLIYQVDWVILKQLSYDLIINQCPTRSRTKKF